MSIHARVSRIDLSRHVRRLWVLCLMDYALVYTSIKILLACGVALWVEEFDTGQWIVYLLFAGVAARCLVVGLRNIGTISSRTWTSYVPTLWLVLATGLLLVASALLAGDNQQALAGGAFGGMMVVGALVALIALSGLNTMPLPGIGVGLKEFARTLADDGHAASEPIDFSQLGRVNLRKGLLYGLLGVAVLVGSAYGAHEGIFSSGNAGNDARIFDAIDWVGFFLLVRMRRYVQIDAQALLRVDHRPPILFLRSFEDEEKLNYKQMGQALFDYSLETRLSRHFMHFGPFVAIGSPGEELPPLGAARIQLTDADWQSQVRRWMADAQAILMYCGNTYWVNWELAMLARRNRMNKVILLFPPRRGWTVRSKKVVEDIRKRLTGVKGALQDTPWSNAIASIEPERTLRALLFGADGTVIAIHCRSDKREAYHLAVLVAHHVLRSGPRPAVLCLKSKPVPQRWPIHGTTSIGADRHNDVALERDAFVSATHARIESDGADLCLVDLNSTNGTFVNEQRLGGARRRLQAGDVIRIGRSTFELERS